MVEVDEKRFSADMGGINDPFTLQMLIWGMEDAASYHNQAHGIYDPTITIREYEQALISLQKALLKLKHGKGTLGAIERTVIRALSEIPDVYLHSLDTHSPYLMNLEPQSLDMSNFEFLLRELIKNETSLPSGTLNALLFSVNDALGNIRRPGKGRARRDASKYVAGILCLIEWFKEALGDHPISSKPDSIFSRYVCFWLTYYMNDEKGDVSRHIKLAKEKAN